MEATARILPGTLDRREAKQERIEATFAIRSHCAECRGPQNQSTDVCREYRGHADESGSGPCHLFSLDTALGPNSSSKNLRQAELQVEKYCDECLGNDGFDRSLCVPDTCSLFQWGLEIVGTKILVRNRPGRQNYCRAI